MVLYDLSFKRVVCKSFLDLSFTNRTICNTFKSTELAVIWFVIIEYDIVILFMYDQEIIDKISLVEFSYHIYIYIFAVPVRFMCALS